MIEYILRNFIVREKIVDEKKLDECMAKQKVLRSKIGSIAVSEGIITERQSETINRLQAVKDMKFGDVAVDRDFMKEEQVEMLLEKQENAYDIFKKVLINSGCIEEKEWCNIIEKFKKDTGISDEAFEAIKSDDAQNIVPVFLGDEAQEYKQLTIIFIKNIIRLIDVDANIGRAYKVNVQDANFRVCQKIKGDQNLIVGFDEAEGGLLQLCSNFGQEKSEELNEDALQEAAEFLNCTNGLYCAMLNQNECMTVLTSTEFEADISEIENDVCIIPVYIRNKKFILEIGRLKNEDAIDIY